LVAIDVGVGRNPRDRRRADRLDPVAHHSAAGPARQGSRATPHRPESNLRRSRPGSCSAWRSIGQCRQCPVARGESCLEHTIRGAMCPTTAGVQRTLGAAGRTARSSRPPRLQPCPGARGGHSMGQRVRRTGPGRLPRQAERHPQCDREPTGAGDQGDPYDDRTRLTAVAEQPKTDGHQSPHSDEDDEHRHAPGDRSPTRCAAPHETHNEKIADPLERRE
jgi:hypothetical protein